MGPTEIEPTMANIADKASIRRETLDTFLELRKTPKGAMYVYGDAPQEAKKIASSPWTTRCLIPSGAKVRLGVSLISKVIDGSVGFAVDCPETLRNGEHTKFFTRLM